MFWFVMLSWHIHLTPECNSYSIDCLINPNYHIFILTNFNVSTMSTMTAMTNLHYSPFHFLESLVFSLTRHQRLLPNQSVGQTSQTHWPLNLQCPITLGHHASACVWANTSNTKCYDSAKSQTHDLLHLSPVFFHQAKSSDIRLGGNTGLQ